MGSSVGGVSYEAVLQNPPNKIELLVIGISSLLVFLFGAVMASITGNIYDVIIGAIIGCSFIFIIWYRQYYNRPKAAQIQKDGISFKYRYGRRDKYVPWSSIYWLNAPPSGPNRIRGIWNQGGYLESTDGMLFILHWSIAIAAKEAYKKAIGDYPPEFHEAM
jgi:hypothetical protein